MLEVKKSRTYRRCEWLTRKIVEFGYTKQIPRRDVERLIGVHLGGDPRTVRKYLRCLVMFDFMKSANPAGTVFEVVDRWRMKTDGQLLLISVDGDEPP